MTTLEVRKRKPMKHIDDTLIGGEVSVAIVIGGMGVVAGTFEQKDIARILSANRFISIGC
jgi:hypothetical protein